LTNDATVAYIIEKPRLGTEEYNRVITQALQNDIQVYGVFGEGKLHVFYYEKEANI